CRSQETISGVIEKLSLLNGVVWVVDRSQETVGFIFTARHRINGIIPECFEWRGDCESIEEVDGTISLRTDLRGIDVLFVCIVDVQLHRELLGNVVVDAQIKNSLFVIV